MATATVTMASSHDLPEVVGLFRAMAATEDPDDPEAAERGEVGLRRSLALWDFLDSDSCFLLLAYLEGELAGYLLAVRIPKADARVGFLFVDELYVLPAFRRRGVARALVERVQALAEEKGLAGVRLLARPENEAARRLYRQCGFEEHEALFCQWQGTTDQAVTPSGTSAPIPPRRRPAPPTARPPGPTVPPMTGRSKAHA